MVITRHASFVRCIALSASLSCPLFPSVAPAQEPPQEDAPPKRHLTNKQKLIAERLTDGDPLVRKSVVEEWGDRKDPEALPFLLSSITDEDTDVRITAILAVTKMKDRKAIEPLIGRLKDEDDGVRYWALKALGEFGDKSAIDPISQALKKDKDAKVRGAAAEALGMIKDPKAIKALAERLNPALESVSDVRMEIVDALAKIGGNEVVAALKKVSAKDPDEWVKKKAANAIAYIESR